MIRAHVPRVTKLNKDVRVGRVSEDKALFDSGKVRALEKEDTTVEYAVCGHGCPYGSLDCGLCADEAALLSPAPGYPDEATEDEFIKRYRTMPGHEKALYMEAYESMNPDREDDAGGVEPDSMCEDLKVFITKDSGKRVEFESGMHRDTQEGKPRYDLCYKPLYKRWAELMARGAEKYGANNWQKSDSVEELERFKGSAERHLMQYLEGDRTEDHAAAVMFNLAACEYLKTKLKRGD